MPRCWPNLRRQWRDHASPSASRLAQTAYARTAAYDAAISTWIAGRDRRGVRRAAGPSPGKLAQTLRYGENPHQAAAFYADGSDRPGVATAPQLQGKELSYNNINDTDAAFELVAEFDPATVRPAPSSSTPTPAAWRAARPCREAYMRAFDCDRTSAFGGIVALNRPLDGPTAAEIVGDLHRGGDRARTPTRTRARSLPRRRTCGC